MSVSIKQTTIFVTVAEQYDFENNPKKMIMARKIHTSNILINKLIKIFISIFIIERYDPPNTLCGLSLDRTDHVVQNQTMVI